MIRKKQSALQIDEIKKIYSGYSGIYDFIFKRFFYPRQRYVINSLGIKPGETVLDVGVGTGLSLPIYPRHCNVIGIDLSSEMLSKAQEKVKKYKLNHVTLMEMDASVLGFSDNAFDYVVAAHVISVVPNPVPVISEIKRVSKQYGKIVIINHFQSQNKFLAKLEAVISPICTKIGWRSDLALEDLITETKLEIDQKYQIKKHDIWKVVYAVNNK